MGHCFSYILSTYQIILIRFLESSECKIVHRVMSFWRHWTLIKTQIRWRTNQHTWKPLTLSTGKSQLKDEIHIITMEDSILKSSRLFWVITNCRFHNRFFDIMVISSTWHNFWNSSNKIHCYPSTKAWFLFFSRWIQAEGWFLFCLNHQDWNVLVHLLTVPNNTCEKNWMWWYIINWRLSKMST